MQRYSTCHWRCPRHAYRIHAARRTNVIARCCQDEVTLRSSMTMRPAFSPPISMSNHARGLSTAPTPPRAKVSFIVFAGFSAISANACFCGPKQPRENSRHMHAGKCLRDHCKLREDHLKQACISRAHKDTRRCRWLADSRRVPPPDGKKEHMLDVLISRRFEPEQMVHLVKFKSNS